MELKRQTCQGCGSREHHNVLRRGEEHPLTVYVICARCKELVARYKLDSYYHHGKGFESWLRRQGASESGRDLATAFGEVSHSSVAEFADVMSELASLDKDL